MPLAFPGEWRFTPPADGQFSNAKVPESAVPDFMEIVDRIPTSGDRQDILEHFKRYLGVRSTSSSEDWAEHDLEMAMCAAFENAPVFIEKFFDACEALRNNRSVSFVPGGEFINRVLKKHNVGYEVHPPDLIALEMGGPPIPVPTADVSVATRAREVLDASLARSEELLTEGRPREAVQEILWLLETVATGFRGLETESGRIEGTYFNKIVRDLRAKYREVTLERVLDWISTMHGYLSSPTGGGVRHGTDLRSGVDLDLNEARLFCNLTRSYISFLLVEHESMRNGQD